MNNIEIDNRDADLEVLNQLKCTLQDILITIRDLEDFSQKQKYNKLVKEFKHKINIIETNLSL